MKKYIEEIITEWVIENFGESEAADPSWDIKTLAEEIASHKRDIWRIVEVEFIEDDIEMVAEGMNNGEGVELTPRQIAAIANDYMTSDDYTAVDQSIEYYIEEELRRSK